MANAAAAVQQDEDPEPADAEPWVLEGWGDGPSVSEAAQQAAMRLGPYVKNVPTTLVGLGGSGTRRVLSAGHQGRSPLKVSEARRKPGPAGPQATQSDRRASGPAALAHGGHPATATVRRAPPPRNLEVGDESDVEPTPPPPKPVAATATLPGPPRILPGQRGPQSQARPPQLAGQSASGAAGRLGRRDAGAAPGGAGAALGAAVASGAAAHPWGPSVGEAGTSGSPRPPRSISAEAYHPSSGAAGSRAGQPGMGRAGPAPPVHVAGAVAHPSPLGPVSAPLQPNPGHLEPLNPLPGRGSAGRAGPGPSDSGTGPAGLPLDLQPPPRSSSFSAVANGQPPGAGDPHDQLSAPNLLLHGVPPPLPGLFPTGRRPSSFRADGGLSGWDSDAPPVQTQQQPQSPAPVSGSNMALWIGPAVTGVGTSGLQVGPAAPGRGSPLQTGQHRRDQLTGGNSRLQRGTAGTTAALPDLGPLGPERSSDRPSQHGGLGSAAGGSRSGGRGPAGGMLHGAAQGSSRTGSPDVKGAGFRAPDQDALTEFCASRADLGSAGAGSGAVGLGTPTADGRGHGGGSSSGMLAPLQVTVPMRVTSLAKMPAAVARV